MYKGKSGKTDGASTSDVSVSVHFEKGINTSIGAEVWTSGEHLQTVDKSIS